MSGDPLIWLLHFEIPESLTRKFAMSTVQVG
jgi:hypothetical protein